MIEVKLTRARQLSKLYPEMRKRLEDWRPIRTDIKRILGDVYEEEYAQNPVGPMKVLGPAIISGEVFDVRGDEVEFGTTVPYASAYDEWRQRNGMPALMSDRRVGEPLGSRILQWVTDGRRS